MAEGIDCITSPPVAALKAAGKTFVCRYLSEVNPATEAKILTFAEAKTLGAGGISIVSNYEWTGQTALGGTSAGVSDAQIAKAQHAAAGGQADRPIYFSVDFVPTAAQMAAVADYFRGVASVIGLPRTGAYGSFQVIQSLLNQKLIAWGWQTYAWSSGLWDSRAQIQQYQNSMTIDGVSVDFDRSTVADFGQWMPERSTWLSTYQENQAEITWNSTTQGAIFGPNVPVMSGLFPAGHTPSYTTGIATKWQSEYMNGRNWGPPISYEYEQANGVQLTDWNGEPISQQNFAGGRAEHNLKTLVITFYPWQ